MDVVNQLFASWEPDAVIMDRETDIYADYTKVRPINFEGQYFKVPGTAEHRPVARKGVRRTFRPADRSGGAISPPSTPIRSSPLPTASRP